MGSTTSFFKNSKSSFLQIESALGNPIPVSERNNLNLALKTGILSALVDCILKSPTIFSSVWEKILKNIEEKCSRLTAGPKRTLLYDNSVTDMVDFKWDRIVEEMHMHCPELLDVLLTVSLPPNSSFENVKDKIKRRICVTYGILMQGRWDRLSLLQRLITVVLTEGGVSKKVSNFFLFEKFVVVSKLQLSGHLRNKNA